ncbi:MAG: adenylate cyclase, partial [Rhodobacteraceae bacterium]|nr:adenylate cyclase [Paracoccaceae bacterium]
MQRRLAAILAADVVDYTRLMSEDQERTLAALRELRNELFEPVVAGHKGNVIKRMGDGWLVEFSSVSDAASCALRIQEGLRGHEIIRLRIGIHTGEVVFENEDIFGDGVNVAARLEQLAEPCEVLLSDNAYQSLDGKAAAQFGGGSSHELKNIARPVTVWRWPAASKLTDRNAAKNSDDVLALSGKPSIAVLPFDNMSGDREQEYFSDGVTEDIITELSRNRWMTVIARNTTFTYKGMAVNVADVARELGVRYIIEGSVRKSSDR